AIGSIADPRPAREPVPQEKAGPTEGANLMRKLLALAGVAFGLGGCGILDGLGGGKDEPAGLRRFSSDQDLLNYFGAQTGAAVNARGDQLAGEADGDVGSGANAPPGAVPSPSDDDGAAVPTDDSATT